MLRTASALTQASSKSYGHINAAARITHQRYISTGKSHHTYRRDLVISLEHLGSARPLLRTTTTAFSKPLTYQTSKMSTSSSSVADPAIAEILHFWFEDLAFEDWFLDSAKHDQTITSRFSPLVEKARTTNELDDTWLSTPTGSLAMILLLDQFSRNIYRVGNHSDPGLSFAGDAKALRIASQSIGKGFDRKIQEEFAHTSSLGKTHRYFFYMPFMHAEDLPSQVAAVSLSETMARECEIVKLQKQIEGKDETEAEKWLREWLVDQSIPFAKLHRNCVAQLGRFPKRNEPLGRKHTEEERKFLEEHPNGF